MWESVFQAATESGIWAILFVLLFFIQIKDSKTREQKYQSTIDALADKLKMIADIKDDVESIVSTLNVKHAPVHHEAANNTGAEQQE